MGVDQQHESADHHYPTFQLIQNQTQLLIQVELKEQCYRWTTVTLKLLKYLNSLLVMALLVTLIQAFGSHNVYDQLPAGARESASEVVRAAREVEIIQKSMEAV